MRCIVIGGGIIGACTALRLAQRGAPLLLDERPPDSLPIRETTDMFRTDLRSTLVVHHICGGRILRPGSSCLDICLARGGGDVAHRH
jgi:hypothetical protein